jgi:hypothetical protein
MREFKDSITGHSKAEDEDDEPPALTKAAETVPPAAAPPVPERESAELGSRESAS